MKCKPIFKWGQTDFIIGYEIMCPGCEESHQIPIVPGTSMSQTGCWTYNANRDKPSFQPSLHIRTGIFADPRWRPVEGDNQGQVCHSFITDGKIQFLSDCTHHLTGQTVELPEIE